MSQELTSAAGTERTSTHEAPSVSADDQAEIDFWTAALEEHSNRAMLNISRQALAKLLGIIGKLRTEQREPVSQEAPNDWEGSYTMLRDALEEHLGAFISDGEEAEEYLYVQGIERIAKHLAHVTAKAFGGGIPRTENEPTERDTWARRHFPDGVDIRASPTDPSGTYAIRLRLNDTESALREARGLLTRASDALDLEGGADELVREIRDVLLTSASAPS
jgi:hypothetical protein